MSDTYTYSMMTRIEDTPDEAIAKLREMVERVIKETEYDMCNMRNLIIEVGESAFHKIIGEVPYVDQRERTIFGIPFIVRNPIFINPHQINLVSKYRQRIDYTMMYDKPRFGECILKEANKMFIGQLWGAKIKNVIFNDPATIVVWDDGTKTVVKAENEPFDPEKGLAMCIAKKAFGNKGNYYDIFRKWLPNE